MSKEKKKAQEMIDEGQVFGSSDEAVNAESRMVQKLVRSMEMCEKDGCNQDGVHAHIVIGQLKNSNISQEELQAMAQKEFDKQIQKKIHEREQAEKRRKLGFGN